MVIIIKAAVEADNDDIFDPISIKISLTTTPVDKEKLDK